MKRKLQLLAGGTESGVSPSPSEKGSGEGHSGGGELFPKPGKSQSQSKRRLRSRVKGKAGHSLERVSVNLGSEQEEKGNEDEHGDSPPQNVDLWRPAPAFRGVDLTVEDSLAATPDIAPDLTKCVLLPKDVEGLRILGDLQISRNTHYHLISVLSCLLV